MAQPIIIPGIGTHNGQTNGQDRLEILVHYRTSFGCRASVSFDPKDQNFYYFDEIKPAEWVKREVTLTKFEKAESHILSRQMVEFFPELFTEDALAASLAHWDAEVAAYEDALDQHRRKTMPAADYEKWFGKPSAV